MSKKTLAFILTAAIAVSIAAAIYTFIPRNHFDIGMAEKLVVDGMTHSKKHGWIFAKYENYNGEFVLYIEGLHRIVFAKPTENETKITDKPDIVIKMEKDLRIYGDIMIYDGKQYKILEYGSYTLPPWVSESFSSGEVRAFTSLGRKLIGVEYAAFPILDAITVYRVTPITLSPYANYFIDVTECRVYDNTIEYQTGDGSLVVFRADTREYDYSTNSEIDRAYIEGEPDHD